MNSTKSIVERLGRLRVTTDDCTAHAFRFITPAPVLERPEGAHGDYLQVMPLIEFTVSDEIEESDDIVYFGIISDGQKTGEWVVYDVQSGNMPAFERWPGFAGDIYIAITDILFSDENVRDVGTKPGNNLHIWA